MFMFPLKKWHVKGKPECRVSYCNWWWDIRRLVPEGHDFDTQKLPQLLSTNINQVFIFISCSKSPSSKGRTFRLVVENCNTWQSMFWVYFRHIVHGVKPLSQPKVAYCHLDPYTHISVKFVTKYYNCFHIKLNSKLLSTKWRAIGLNLDEQRVAFVCC